MQRSKSSNTDPEEKFRNELIVWESKVSKPLSKKERKRLRWAKIIDPDWKGFDDDFKRDCRGKARFGEWLLYQLKGLHIVCRASGDRLDYSPESLKEKFDNTSSGDMARDFENWGKKAPDIWDVSMIYLGIGGYFGEVIVRNLGGKWRFPSRYNLTMAQLKKEPEILLNGYYIIHERKIIPVMKIVRWRFDGSSRIKSLYEVYEKIRTTGNWR